MAPSNATPLLRWVGGKRWLAPRIAAICRTHLTGEYYEPFMGSAAVYFALQPQTSTLGDVNYDLVRMYRAVQANPAKVKAALKMLPLGKASYMRIRQSTTTSEIQAAARFLYLNSTSYGGVYRTNSRGEYNVPFGGRGTSRLTDSRRISEAAIALHSAKIVHGDFERTMEPATSGDVIYCDPVYAGVGLDACFTRYGAEPFTFLDVLRLFDAAERATARGATVLISGPPEFRAAGLGAAAEIKSFRRHDSLAGARAIRGRVTEHLFIMQPKKTRRTP